MSISQDITTQNAVPYVNTGIGNLPPGVTPYTGPPVAPGTNLPVIFPTANGGTTSTPPRDPNAPTAPAPSSTGPSSSGTPDPTQDLMGWITSTLKSYNSPEDPNYWYNRIMESGGYSPYWATRIKYAQGGPLAGQQPGGSAQGGLPSSITSSILPTDPSVWTQPYGQQVPVFTAPNAPIPSFSFNAPTEAQAEQYPGYQFARDQALLAMQNSAAGKGLLNSGGTVYGLGQLANSLASQNYNSLWNQQFQAANTAFQNQLAAQGLGFNQASTTYGNQLAGQNQGYNQYAQNANDTWNRVHSALTA